MNYLAAFATIIIISTSVSMFKSNEKVKEIDFGISKVGNSWRVMNDGVMGGLSKGEASVSENSLKLEGEISLANNGGFSSVRSPWSKYDLSGSANVNIRYRSTGQTVALCLETNYRWWQPFYLIDLKATDGEWKNISIPITSAKEKAYARSTGKTLSVAQLSKILRIGFMTNEKKASPFEFEVDFIKFE